MSDNNNLAQTCFEQAKEFMGTQVETLVADDGTKAQVALVPSGIEVVPLKKHFDANRSAPQCREGTAVLTDSKSFSAFVNRFKDEGSILFADDSSTAPSILAILDYHPEGANAAPRFGRHRAKYNLPVSKEWEAWTQLDGQMFSQLEFAEFLEDRIVDVLHVAADAELSDRVQQFKTLINGNFASPSKLLELSTGLSINSDEKMTQQVNLQTGETEVAFSAQHRDGAGDSVKVPKMFMIGIPVFKGGAAYQIAVRLRYRARGGAISWFYEMYQTQAQFDDACLDACEEVRAATALPLLMGAPEKV